MLHHFLLLAMLLSACAAVGLVYPLTLGRFFPQRGPGGGTFVLGLILAMLSARAIFPALAVDMVIPLLGGFAAVIGHYLLLAIGRHNRTFGPLTDRETSVCAATIVVIGSLALVLSFLPLFLAGDFMGTSAQFDRATATLFWVQDDFPLFPVITLLVAAVFGCLSLHRGLQQARGIQATSRY
jgi:hypothetical protein